MLNLTKDDIKYLRDNCGENDICICQIVRAFDKTEFEIWDYKDDLEHKNEPVITKISNSDVLKTIDKDIIVSGMDRSAFHYTAVRDIGNNKLLYFNSHKFFNEKDNIAEVDKKYTLLFKKLFDRDYHPNLWEKYWNEGIGVDNLNVNDIKCNMKISNDTNKLKDYVENKYNIKLDNFIHKANYIFSGVLKDKDDNILEYEITTLPDKIEKNIVIQKIDVIKFDKNNKYINTNTIYENKLNNNKEKEL